MRIGIRIAGFVEEFKCFEVSRIIKQEVTFVFYHIVGGLGIDGCAFGVGGILVLVTPVFVFRPLCNLLVVIVCGFATPAGPNLTCTHIPDIAHHVAVVGLVVFKFEVGISLCIEFLKFIFPICTGFAHVVAISVFHRNEGHLVG